MHERARRPCSHRPRELPLRLLHGRLGAPQTWPRRRTREPTSDSRPSDTRRPWPVPRRVSGGFRPLATIHREQRKLGFGVDDGIGVARVTRPPSTFPRTRVSAWSTSPSEQERLGLQEERGVAPRAPRRLWVDREGRIGHHLLGAAGTDDRAEHRPRRVERRRAVQWYRDRTTPRRRSRPIAGPRSSARSTPRPTPASTASGGYRSMSESPSVDEPALHRGHVAGAVGGEDQRRQQLHAPVEFRGVEAGARAPWPGIRWTRTSRQLAGAAWGSSSGSTRRSSPSRNSRNNAW